MNLFEQILAKRGLSGSAGEKFLNPDYTARHDPFLLPDMEKAVERLVVARQKQEKITIYGDYDIDGLTATTVLVDALASFGFEKVETFIPNRFVEGYGMTVEAVEKIAETGAELIITVDCGSLSEKEIVRAGELGIDVIVTDHHNVAAVQPPAVAVINPKRILMEYPDEFENYILKPDSKMQGKLYPFLDLPGVGVAFKLIEALQTRLEGLPKGQEKWLLDLVALGTVCDVVTLRDENRTHVYWGLKVLASTRRPGLKALMAVAGVDSRQVNARSLGFGLGPRMNAAGRLETATFALDMLLAREGMLALEKARVLDEMNSRRRAEQDEIFKQALVQAENYKNDSVLVVSAADWNHGIIGIVAAKLLEKFKKPTFVLQEDVSAGKHEASAELQGEGQDSELTSESKRRGEPLLSKGSARSYGDFSAADAIRAADDVITKGGGHKLAAGVTLPTDNIDKFRKRVNQFYKDQNLKNQADLLLPRADATATFSEVDEALVNEIARLEPFGSGNPQPILLTDGCRVVNVRKMGADNQHVKLTLEDGSGSRIDMLAFNAPQHFFVDLGETVRVWYQPDINEWQGRRSVEGRLLHLESA